MRRLVFATGLILSAASFAACDTASSDVDTVSTPVALPPTVEEMGGDARYVHALVSLDSSAPTHDWCINASLVTKGRIQAQGVFCLGDSEVADGTLLANLKCDPDIQQALVVTVEDVTLADGGDWADPCGDFGCTTNVLCNAFVEEVEVAIPVTRAK